jgi:hypothetical protein
MFYEIHTSETHVESTLQGFAILVSFLVSAVFHEVLYFYESSTLGASCLYFSSHQLEWKMAWLVPCFYHTDLGNINDKRHLNLGIFFFCISVLALKGKNWYCILLRNSHFIVFVNLQLCIAVPCHIFKLWAFSGIMFQV